jgi:hypothetical protein
MLRCAVGPLHRDLAHLEAPPRPLIAPAIRSDAICKPPILPSPGHCHRHPGAIPRCARGVLQTKLQRVAGVAAVPIGEAIQRSCPVNSSLSARLTATPDALSYPPRGLAPAGDPLRMIRRTSSTNCPIVDSQRANPPQQSHRVSCQNAASTSPAWTNFAVDSIVRMYSAAEVSRPQCWLHWPSAAVTNPQWRKSLSSS